MGTPPRGPQRDQPTEPGWWLASDGNWYPPESAPSTPASPTAAGVEPAGSGSPGRPAEPVPPDDRRHRGHTRLGRDAERQRADRRLAVDRHGHEPHGVADPGLGRR